MEASFGFNLDAAASRPAGLSQAPMSALLQKTPFLRGGLYSDDAKLAWSVSSG
jgi:hypothetical protein